MKTAAAATGAVLGAVSLATVAHAASSLDVRYRCDDGRVVEASYPQGAPEQGMTLTIAGRKIAFRTAMSADGGRYLAVGGLHPHQLLEWWIKGDGATLSEGPAGEPADNADKTIIATCKVVHRKS